MDFEHSEPLVEVRSDGRRLSGPALLWGETSATHRERFLPGSISLDSNIKWLDLDHDERLVLASTDSRLAFKTDSKGLHLEADLSPRLPLLNEAIASVESGKRTGLSIEFRAVEEHQESGLRVVEKAVLAGVGLVRHPSYESSSVELRRKGWLRSSIPFGKKLYCECQKGADCEDVIFEEGSFAEYTAPNKETAGEVLAIAGGFDSAFASLRRGSLKLYDDPDGLRIVIDKKALDTTTGTRIAELVESVPVAARPIIDEGLSKATLRTLDGVKTNVYSKVSLRAILFKPLAGPRADSWPEVELDKAPEKRVIAPLRPAGRRRIWL